MKVAVIGGGASGLVCSIFASSNNSVTLFEKNNICGKKILITGNGKCNYFNDDFNINNYHSNDIDILSKIITDDNKKRILDFFNSIGIVPKITNGYYYPISSQSTTIEQSLIIEAKNLGVNIVCNYDVVKIDYVNNKYIINDEFEFDALVVSTGGLAAPKTGSTGFGYEIGKQFNHSIIDTYPALVQLKGNSKYFKDWAGIRSDVLIKHYENNKYITESEGEIQLTDYGVSGICIYQLSSKIIRGLNNGLDETIYINFLPWVNNIKEYLDSRNKLLKNRNIQELLDGLLNYKLVNMILRKNKIENTNKYEELNNSQLNNLINDLTNYRVDITDYNDFDKAQVTSGGIPLSEININTFESLKQNNLYFIGEVLDVDGNCGGYNLAFAWLSGIIAGESIGR